MKDIDMNDPETLELFTAILSFVRNPENKGMALMFPSTITRTQRDTLHRIASKLKLHRLCDPEEAPIALTSPPTPPVQDNVNLTSPSSIPEFGYYRPFPTPPGSLRSQRI